LLSCPAGCADKEDAAELLLVCPIADRESGRNGLIGVIDTSLSRSRHCRFSIIANRVLPDPRMMGKSHCDLEGGEGQSRSQRCREKRIPG
jgi:hypothetical protein